MWPLSVRRNGRDAADPRTDALGPPVADHQDVDLLPYTPGRGSNRGGRRKSTRPRRIPSSPRPSRGWDPSLRHQNKDPDPTPRHRTFHPWCETGQGLRVENLNGDGATVPLSTTEEGWGLLLRPEPRSPWEEGCRGRTRVPATGFYEGRPFPEVARGVGSLGSRRRGGCRSLRRGRTGTAVARDRRPSVDSPRGNRGRTPGDVSPVSPSLSRVSKGPPHRKLPSPQGTTGPTSLDPRLWERLQGPRGRTSSTGGSRPRRPRHGTRTGTPVTLLPTRRPTGPWSLNVPRHGPGTAPRT